MGKSRIFYFIKYTVDCVRLEMMPPFLREIASVAMTHDEHRKFVSDLHIEAYRKVVCNR
jgi:hypothetical protein